MKIRAIFTFVFENNDENNATGLVRLPIGFLITKNSQKLNVMLESRNLEG